MERSVLCKPYYAACKFYPEYEEEIARLPPRFLPVIAQFPFRGNSIGITEKSDFFHQLVESCYALQNLHPQSRFFSTVCAEIQLEIAESRRENSRLYNPYRNLCLNKCYGESKTPLIDYFAPDDSHSPFPVPGFWEDE